MIKMVLLVGVAVATIQVYRVALANFLNNNRELRLALNRLAETEQELKLIGGK